MVGDSESWIEERLAAALEAATTDIHAFPDAVSAELRRLLGEQFQQTCKPTEMKAIAAALISANRGKK